jgi:peptide/nickel transport system permease protein
MSHASLHNGATVKPAAVPRRIARALLAVALTALAGGLSIAALVRFSPGFGFDEEQSDPRLSRESVQALRHRYDGERNPVRFFLTWSRRVVAGDAGFSRSLGRPVGELLTERAPVTARLMAYGITGAWLIAFALTAPAAALRLSKLSAGMTALAAAAACLPAAGLAVLLFQLGGSARWMIVAILFPKLYQYLRNLLRQGFAMPHVLLARAKGLHTWRILFRHVLYPGRAQLLSLAAVSLNMGFGAAVAVEAVCDLPGIGQLAWKAALARDLPVLVAVTVLVTLFTQISNLAADLSSSHFRSHA